MPRFFVPPVPGGFVPGGRAVVSGEDAAHISRSLRLRPGDAITLCDGGGMDYEGRILSVGDAVEVELLECVPSVSEPRCRITLFQALPKGEKMEFIDSYTLKNVSAWSAGTHTVEVTFGSRDISINADQWGTQYH